MYKKILCLLLGLFMFCGCDKSESVLRFHVVANSNSEIDQSVKMEIKDALYRNIATSIKDVTSVETGKEIIRNKESELINISNSILKSHNLDYETDIKIGRFDFPTKSYGDTVYPAGNYEAVRVELGKAEGENWWCVLFPPICFVDASTTDFDTGLEAKTIEFESIFKKIFTKVGKGL